MLFLQHLRSIVEQENSDNPMLQHSVPHNNPGLVMEDLHLQVIPHSHSLLQHILPRLYLASQLIDTLDDRLILTQFIEGTPSKAQDTLSGYTRDTQEAFTQDSFSTEWAEGDESSRLVVDLEAAKIGPKRVKKTVEKPDKPKSNEKADTVPPEPTRTIYGYLFYLSYSTFPFVLTNFSTQKHS